MLGLTYERNLENDNIRTCDRKLSGYHLYFFPFIFTSTTLHFGKASEGVYSAQAARETVDSLDYS
jgi:hypothetical protein